MNLRREFIYAAAALLTVVVSAQKQPLPKGKGIGSQTYSLSKTTLTKMGGKGGGDGTKFSGHLLGKCKPLEPPMSGSISCSSTARRMTCTATCLEGFEFNDKSTVQKLYCNNNDGLWTPDTKIADCSPVCNPICENGGRCFGHNRCVCTPQFRGEICQYPVTNCNGEKLHTTGGFSCNHTAEESLCTISCPPGMEFEYPPAGVYICDLMGRWSPKQAPKCIGMDVIVHTLPSVTVEPFKDSKLVSRELKEGICSTWGQRHYRTFDGTLYSAQGKCTYLLAKDCASNTFSVHVQNDPKCNNVRDCMRRVIIYINHEKYTLENIGNGPNIYWGDNRLNAPTTINGLLIEEVAHYIVVRSGIGFILRWNGKDSITTEVSPKLMNNTCGLCGRYDGNPSNDLEMLDGTVMNTIETFVNSWKMNDLGEACPDSTKLEHSCTYNGVESKQISDKASEICRQIFLPEYSSCHALIDPQPYYEMCRLDFCTCGSLGDVCMCSSLSNYFQECHSLGGKLTNGWRKGNFCPFECSGDMIYRDCGSSCSLTCKKALQECSDEQCVDGCHCPEGTVLHNGRCIKSTECPCQYAGKTYTNGKSIQRDCNTCVCDGGEWKCTNEKCESRCSAVGDPHYTTFDGKHYNFMGKCSYYLIYADDFSIEQENVACSGAISEQMGFIISPSSDFPSCTKSLTIRNRGTVLRLKQRKEVVLNGKDIYELPISAQGIYVYAASSIFIKVELDNNMTVTWDGNSRVYVDAPLTFLDNTKGLCGTFNYNQKDDFLTNENDVEPDVNAFANKWKTSDTCHDIAVGEGLRDPCELYSQRQQKSEALCGRLKSEIFSICHDVVDPEPYYKNCVYDMCYCQSRVMSCLCPAISDYAAECSKKNVLVDWRASVRECGINCPGGQVYQICGSSCKRSCVDISYHPNCREQCVEGCNCPTGTTLNGRGECVAISTCSCIHGGTDYQPGHKDMRGNLTCECINAKWECRPATKEELIDKFENFNETKPLCSAAANMEYTDCASDCPTTCKNMHSPPKCDTSICKQGCRCKKGYVLDTKSSSCVKTTQCPCHHGGQSYSEGETIKEDCNTCVCDGGLWSCEKNDCPRICSAWGESHFKTFDGRMFEFHGDCDYILARGGGDSKWETFQVTLHNVPCGTSDVTCSKSVTLAIDDEKVTLAAEKPLPTIVFGKRYILRVVGLYVFIHTDIGLTLQWDRITRVYVRADPRWKDKIEGLCGNFNGNENDDFKTSDGGPPVAMATMFGDSWRIHNYCPLSKIIENTCDLHPHRKSWAAQKCSVLKSSNFKPCHSEVPFEPYLERCIFDSCGCDMGGDCDCFCTAVAAYAQECNVNGIAIAWRSQELCPIQCDPGRKYVPCMSVCPQLTCETQYLYSELEVTCGREVCVEGCEPIPCNQSNQMYKNDREFECMAKSQCVAQPCRIINGRMYYEGEKVTDPDITDPCQSCHCRSGDIACVGKKCAPTTVMPTVSPYEHRNSTEEATAFCENGWTNWMNGFTPNYKNGGDYETFDLLRKRLFTFCPPESMKEIECRTAGTHVHYKDTDQNVYCSLPEGLKCENKDQPVIKLCNDYEIRIYCQCEETITTEYTTPTTTTTILLPPIYTPRPEISTKPPLTCDDIDKAVDGWTSWMNVNSASDNPDGDIETRDVLRTEYEFCADRHVVSIECRQVGSNVSFDVAGQYGVVCDLNHGLKCLHSMQPSGKCKDYEVRFYCVYNCESETTTQPSTSITESTTSLYSFEDNTTCVYGWTDWINRDSPLDDGNDVEDLQSVPNFYQRCRKAVSYQCRNARTKELFRQTTDPNQKYFTQRCNSKGIVCEAGNGQEPCDDYEIRAFCICPLGSEGYSRGECIPKWTDWFDTDDPYKGEGDFEQIEDINEEYHFCNAELITSIECQARAYSVGTKQTNASAGSASAKGGKTTNTTTSGTWINYAEAGDIGVKCSPLTGLACYNSFQPKRRICRDYRVRFYCSCGMGKDTPPSNITYVTTTAVPTPTTTALCMPGKTWENCAYRCDRMCQSFHHQSIKRDFCSRGVGNKTCIAGCVENECKPPYVWRDESTCVKPEDCTCLTNDGQLIPPGEIVNVGNCERCQCIANGLDCTISKDCGALTTEYPTSTTMKIIYPVVTQSTTTPSAPIFIEQDNCWTAWINTNTPTNDKPDDIEDLASIRNRFTFCSNPIMIECRTLKTKINYLETKQSVSCKLNFGLQCLSQSNPDLAECLDYEVRFFCPCASNVTTYHPGTVKPTPAVIVGPASICVGGNTPWFSAHTPDRDGEYENIQMIRQAGHVFCDNEHITAMECRVRGTDIPQYKSNDSLVTCSILEGLSCDARLQNHPCSDYEVRFYCQCESTTITEEMTTTTPITPVTPVIQTVTFMTIPPPCSYWSGWINDDKPWLGIGDVEILKRPNSFCSGGEVQDIECVTADGNVPYNKTTQRRLECSLDKGFVCKNNHQPEKLCNDYKIRYYCGCVEGTTTSIPTTTIMIVPPPKIPGITPACSSYFYIVGGDQPIPDSQFKASSSLNSTYGPQNSRMTSNNKNSGGVWMAAQKDENQYIEVDLGDANLVYGVVTQGNPNSRTWVTSYYVLYSVDGRAFSYVSEKNGSAITFKGNYDDDSIVRNLFTSPMEARFVRILPIYWERAIALKFDVLGCNETQIPTTPVASTPTTRSPIICDDKMGLESDVLPNGLITASSFYDSNRRPKEGRINNENYWSPKSQSKNEFFQVDFTGTRVISGVSTQGSSDSAARQWVTSYYVSFSTDGVTWSNTTDATGQTEIYAGNYDTNSVVTNHFDQSVRARYVRIVPQTWHNWIALRVEIKGCFQPYIAPPMSSLQCDDPMGMQGGQITNNMIKVSSSMSGKSTGGGRARLHMKEEGQASSGWVAGSTDDAYLMVDFGVVRNVTGLITQGREKRGEWVKKYKVIFSVDGKKWYEANDENGNDLFVGNTDDEGAVAHMFEKMIAARLIKIIPFDWERWISLRLEIVGCFIPYPDEGSTSTCRGSLNANIPWNKIEISSSLTGERSGASRLALDTPENVETGGWVAEKSNKRQFIIIDYGETPVEITGIVTQGRNKHQEWVIKYEVFTSNDRETWTTAVDETGNSLLTGNNDSDTPVQRILKDPVKARYLKIVPNKWKDWIAMRLDVLGCPPPPSFTEPSESCKGSLNSTEKEVSSSLSGIRSGSARLALNTLEGEDTGGWVSAKSDNYQFIIIDYGIDPVNITGIVTQGRNKHPEWVTDYEVYMSSDRTTWMYVADETNNTLFNGNIDSDTPVHHYFQYPVTTSRYLKIVPVKWHDWISMRLDVLGCPQSTTTTNECFTYGPWLSLNVPSPNNFYSDNEPIGDLIHESRVCTNPVQIECRETTSKKSYDQMGQKLVSCDLTKGFACDSKKSQANCYNYEARIVCWTCGTTTSTVAPTNAVLCPEVPPYITSSCPNTCPLGYVCDGKLCVDPSNCPCVRNGKYYPPGERFTTSDCDECVCKLNGHSYCVRKSCPPCSQAGRPGRLNERTCDCECKQCAENEKMCESNQQCLRKDLWCDGVVDCPDDEKNCPTTTTTTIPTTLCPPAVTPTCVEGSTLELMNPKSPCPTYACVPVGNILGETTPSPPPPLPPPPRKNFCEISGSYIKTFDNYTYKNDICDHILFQDKPDGEKFMVARMINCSLTTGQCWYRLNVTQDDHVIIVDEHMNVSFDGTVYTDSQLIKISRKNLGFSMRVIGDSVMIKSTKYNYEVFVNVDQDVRIGVTDVWYNKVNGLCGLYNGNVEDDLQMPDDTKFTTITRFGNSWRKENSKLCTTDNKQRVCSREIMAKTYSTCQQLIAPPFKTCNNFVDPSLPLEACADNLCECLTNPNSTEKDCLCKAFLPYVETCGMMGFVNVRYWLEKQSCFPTCPPGLVWMDCGSECERTCDTLQDYHYVGGENGDTFQQVEWSASSTTNCVSERCVPGCFCPVGLVRKGDHCVLPEKCQDCVCKGYGDPHYFTFDGTYFPFQGNCTYILAQDILEPGKEQNHKFEVFATNEDCFEEPMTTCTVALILLFNGHMAHFRVNESVTFDGVQLYYSDFPFHAYGIHIESIPGRSITFSVPEINLEVRYFELNYGFELRIPSEVYYNKTEGLCGNCNFNESDDFRCPYGRMTNDTNDFGFSWIAKPPEGFESVNEICKVKVEEDKCSKPTIEQGMCDLILSEEFSSCHELVDPNVYVKACRFDVCHSVSPTASLCRSVTEYARKCAGLGICIQNWRKPDFCPYECPAGMQFDQCGPACPKSCKDVHNGWKLDVRTRHGKDIDGERPLLEDDLSQLHQQTMQELVDVCDTAPVDGCFCIGNTIFHNGTCVDPILCELCDSSGHKVGDTWRTDACTTCTCSLTQSIECMKTMCPSKPICKQGQSLKLLTSADKDTCCAIYDCVTNTLKVICPTVQLPKCLQGEVMRIETNKEGCTRYVCECDILACPPIRTPTNLEIGEETLLDKSSCCPTIKRICSVDKCPKLPVCGKHRQLRERDNSKSRCCKEYYCEAPPNVCLFVHEYEVLNGTENKLKPANRVTNYYKPGEVWTDGLCRRCTCDGRDDVYTHHCNIELCPQLSDYQEKDQYEWKTEVIYDVCCPRFTRKACVDNNGKSYSIGEEWDSTDGDKCKSFRCGLADNGEAIRVQRTVKCIKECGLGFKYIEPVDTTVTCCGQCESVACVENGKLYQVGNVWNSTNQPCSTAECIKLDGKIKTRFSYTVCKPVQEGCTKKIRSSDGCCEICNGTITYPSLQVCVPQKVKPEKTKALFEMFIGNVHCINNEPINGLMACVGNCESTSIYSSGKKDFLSSCECCSPKETKKKIILLDCSDDHQRPFDYLQPVQCECTQCAGNHVNVNQTVGVQLDQIY